MKGGNEVSEAARSRAGEWMRFVAEQADFGATRFQSGTDLVGGITHSPSGEPLVGYSFLVRLRRTA